MGDRKPEDRVERIVNDLLAGRRLKLRGGDAEDKDAITAAARLAGSRQAPQRMHPAFRKRLAQSLVQTPRDAWLTRRAALVAGLGLAAGAAGGVLLGRDTSAERRRSGGEAIDPIHGRWIDVAAMSDLVEGHGQHVVAGAVGAFVFRHGDSVTAVSDMCSHLPCQLWWDKGNTVLQCPCHPVSFNADGHPSDGYQLPSLNQVHVRVTAAGRVEVLGTA